MNQPRPLTWSNCFSLAGAGSSWSSPDLTSLDLSIIPNTSYSEDDLGGRSCTTSPVSSLQLSDVSFDAASKFASLDLDNPVMRNPELSYSDSKLLRKSRRQAPSLETRRTQNRAAQRAYRQRATLHLKAVEEELSSVKQKYGELMQRYDELNCWSNGLLSALLERDPTWTAASGMKASGE